MMEYSTAGVPYLTTAAAVAAPPPSVIPPPPPSAVMAPPPTVGMLPYGVEIPNRVFVGGCPFSMTDQQLAEFFRQYGTIKDSKIISDRNTGKSKGYGFVTFSTEEEAATVHAMGSIFYKEKKLNLSRAIRKCGGQFNRANQEFVNGQRAVWAHPSGYLIQQYDGSWHIEHHNHSQPVKPFYAPPPPPVYYQPAPPLSLQPQQQFFGTGWSPPPNTYPPTPPQEGEEEGEGRGEEGQPSETSSPDEATKKDPTDADQLDDKLKQLSLDSAYTSEADLDSSTHSPGEQTPPETHEVADGNGVIESHDPEQHQKMTSSPSFVPVQPQRPMSLSAHVRSFSPPQSAGLYTGGLYQPSPTYFNPYTAPYSYPYTPPGAVQTIGPVYHGNY